LTEAPDLVAGLWRPLYVEWRNYAINYVKRPIAAALEKMDVNPRRTLKQTHSENGSVTMTIAQENAVRSHPQTPIPTSLSWAAKKKKSEFLA
jgi:hypothetical protein